MYSASQIETLASLDKYFSETPESTIQAEIEAITELDFVGTSAKDYFLLFQKYHNYEPFNNEFATVQARVNQLLEKNRTTGLTADEETEMERYMTVEHIVRLAKAKALQNVNAHLA